jgi:hypothetical protein
MQIYVIIFISGREKITCVYKILFKRKKTGPESGQKTNAKKQKLKEEGWNQMVRERLWLVGKSGRLTVFSPLYVL